MLKHVSQILIIIIIVNTLFACGGGSSSPVDEVVPLPTAAKGALTLNISGLPDTSQGSVKLTGPNGYSQTNTSTTTVQDLTPGNYNVTAEAITTDGLTYTLLPATQSVSITQDQTAIQSITYMTDVTSIGVISNFGSVYVNGVRYSTDDVEVETDDSTDASEDDLDLGMVVTVQGRTTADNSINVAGSIKYRVNAKGPVSMVSLSLQQVSVFNQVFNIDESTLFINTTLEQLLTDDIVEISAIPDASGQWLATRIEKQHSVTEFRLRGAIANLDDTNQTFSIVDTVIDYSSATIQGVLADGAKARVSSTQGLVDGVLIANDIRVESNQASDDKGQIALDGVIQSIEGSEFVIQGQTVEWDDSTEFKGGSSLDLAVNVRVKVHGTLNENNLLASKIRLDKPSVIKVEGAIESIDLENNQIQLLGMLFTFDTYSQIKDDSSDDIRRFSLALLAIGDRVEIMAFASGDNLTIKKLERQAKDTEVNEDKRFDTKLEGQVSEITSPSLQLRGSTVITSSLTKFELAEDEVDFQTFFDALSVGDWIEIKGTLQQDGSVVAVKVETDYQTDGDDDNEENDGVEFTGVIDEFISVNQFKVNGHSISTNERTVFTHGLPAQLALMQRVEIHGHEADDGSILATRVQFEDGDDENQVEFEGALTGDALDGVFNMDDQLVSFGDSTVFKDGSADDLVAGANVEIKGKLDENNVLVAFQIEFEDDHDDEAEVVGNITEIVNADAFYVGDQLIILQTNTQFKLGNSTRLAIDVWVKVEGYFDDQQQLIAKKIIFSKD